MQSKNIARSILIVLSLTIYMLLVGLIRDNMANRQHKFWVNIISTCLLTGALIFSIYKKEKSSEKPDYKLYFYFIFFFFLFISIL